jgi:hypothetical protein
MNKSRSISHEDVTSQLDYDPATGIFIWKPGNGRKARYVGKRAGCIASNGYRYIRVQTPLEKVLQKASILAWLYVYGVYPEGNIDHLNGIKDDDRFCNLRDANQAQNVANSNRVRQASNYYYDSRYTLPWCVRILRNNEVVVYKRFASEEEASVFTVQEKKRLFCESY